MTRDLVSVLGQHRHIPPSIAHDDGMTSACSCGTVLNADLRTPLWVAMGEFRAHLAAVIEAEVIRPREREAWERGRSAATRTNPFAGEVES